MTSTYFHLQSLAEHACETDKTWLEKAKKKLICPACCTPFRNQSLPPIPLVRHPDEVPLNFVRELSLEVISLDFLTNIGGDGLSSSIEMGEIISPNGVTVLEDYFTIRARNQEILIRGDGTSNYRKCEFCENRFYYPRGRRYVLRDDVSDNLPIYQSHFGILIREDIHQKIADKKYKKLSITKMLVLNESRDGIELDIYG